MPRPANRKKIVNKKLKKFVRFQSDLFKRVKPAWRFSHGIDSRIRRGFRGTRPKPNIGYGSDNSTKYLLPNHFYAYKIRSPKELEPLLMNNHKYCAVIGSTVGARKRKLILERASQLNVKVFNPTAKFRTEEHE
eukprot:TRINITY_DN42_c0_g1_i2.p1 TRINITY_DN42_c0_g1~~TRINITY_DN42_c0_g1_i2.p1  ORF type:complete len:134 (+),score=17.52 TRINITY_DN42_c0_g1_i2:73-474(+)